MADFVTAVHTSPQHTDNKTLAYFQSLIGQSMEGSPSPVGQWLNGTFEKVEYGSITASFQIRAEMTNPYGSLHGGIICTIMDDMIGATVYAMELGANFSNLNFNIDYLSYAVMHQHVRVHTEVHRVGKKIVNASCELFLLDKSQEIEMLARGSSNLVCIGAVDSRQYLK